MDLPEKTEDDIKQYKDILNEDIGFVNEACVSMLDSDKDNVNEYLNNIKYYPKCAVRSAMQECECKEDCVLKLFNIAEWSDKCGIYDLNEIYNIERYINCNGATHRPYKGIMRNYYFGNNVENAKKAFLKYADGLCDNPLLIRKLECAAYEFRDECANDKDCYGDINNKWTLNCTNIDRRRQWGKVLDILYNNQYIFKDENKAVSGRRFTDSELSNMENYREKLFGRRLLENDESLAVDRIYKLDDSNDIIKPLTGVVLIGLWGVASYAIYKCKSIKGNRTKTAMVFSSGLASLLVLLLV